MGRLRRGTSCARVSLATAPNGVRTSTAARAGTRRLRRALRVRAERRGDRLTRLDRLVKVAQRELQGAEEVQDVLQRHEAEVTDADELPIQLALPARDDRVVVIAQDADEVARVHARSLIVTMETPGGAPHAFCEAVMHTSMPHSSISSSAAPAPETLSTMKSLPDSRTTSLISLIGLRTPVDVSLCWIRTAFAPSLPFSFASSSRTRSGSTARPSVTSMRRASTP